MLKKTIHFPIISSERYRPSVLNVARARGVIKKYNMDSFVDVTYRAIVTRHHVNDINVYKVGKTILELQDLDHIVSLINNYKNKRPLLENIPIPSNFKRLIDKVDSYYNKKLDYTCLVLSVFRPFTFITIYIGLLVKLNNPDMDISVGGCHINISKHLSNLLRFTKIFEYVVEGDLEAFLKKYLLDELHKFEDYELYIDLKNDYIMPIYTDLELKLFKYVVFETNRNCPNKCVFCSGGFGNFRTSSVDDIIDTFEYYNTQDIDFEIVISDCTLNYSSKRTWEIIEGVSRVKNRRRITSNLVSKGLDYDILKALRQADFGNLFIGNDTFSSQMNSMFLTEPKINELYLSNLSSAYDLGFYITTSMIYAIPGETEELFNYNFEFMKSIRERFPNKNMFEIRYIPYGHNVGSVMYFEPERFGITYEYWDEIDCYDNKLNSIITQVPRYLYYNVDRDTYISRYKLVSDWSENCSYNAFNRDLDNLFM